jgi:hypothetical protein
MEKKTLKVYTVKGTDLPFKVDGEIPNQDGKTGFSCRTIRGNAKYNLSGEIEAIKSFIAVYNMNDQFNNFHAFNLLQNGEEKPFSLLP